MVASSKNGMLFLLLVGFVGCLSLYHGLSATCKLSETAELALVEASSFFRTSALVTPSSSVTSGTYTPSSLEEYMFDHFKELQFDQDKASGCSVWLDENKTSTQIHQQLQTFKTELATYNERIDAFDTAIEDVRLHFDDTNSDQIICETLKLDPEGLAGIFGNGHLSLTPSSGAVEPLLPPLRSPSFCFGWYKQLLSLDYLVHDFPSMCRQLKKTSRTVLVDMGASLKFHGSTKQPAMYLIHLYKKFGFKFDHIYAYESKPTKPEAVFKIVPKDIQAAYHWINVGVSPDPTSDLNPLKMILDNFNQEDLIVVKLDIDTPSVELPLVLQLLEDDRYAGMIDQFYFEHHVHLTEMKGYWLSSMRGTVEYSMNLFAGLRKKGIAAHYWV